MADNGWRGYDAELDWSEDDMPLARRRFPTWIRVTGWVIGVTMLAVIVIPMLVTVFR